VPEHEADLMTIEAYLGKKQKIITASELVDQKRASPLKIRCCVFVHPLSTYNKIREEVKALEKLKGYKPEAREKFNIERNIILHD